MTSTPSILILLKFYASRQNTAIINYYEFSSYVKKYAQHHVEEQPEFIPFLGDSDTLIDKELQNLKESKYIVIAEPVPKKRVIFVISMYVHKYEKLYQDIVAKPTIPFPIVSDLPKQTPNGILNKQNASELLYSLLDKQELNDRDLFCITIPHDVPAILFPSSVPVTTLMEICLAKIRSMLMKDEFHDYFEKKIRISNPGKEIAARNFFISFIQSPEQSLRSLKETGDSFYFFSQLCFFIRQDYENIKDFTQEDLNVLQSVYITEIVIAYYKNELQKKQQRDTALEVLKHNFLQLPYYYSMDTVLGFTDSHGISLRGQYTDQDLKIFLEKETTCTVNNELPKLLVFKIASGSRFFIYKERVFPLVLRLCSDAHESIGQHITEKWYNSLKEFQKLPEMTEQAEFEKELEMETRTNSQVLYALLHANFLPILGYELRSNSTDIHINLLFSNNQLLPYSELLMLKRQTLLSNAKILLPFWYTIPILVWFCSLFHKKNNRNEKPQTSFSDETITQAVAEDINGQKDASHRSKTISRKEALIQSARKLEKQFVQTGSSIERELDSYDRQWNKMINTKMNQNLRSDVDSLVRDYMKKIIRSLNGSTFTSERVQNLAETLCNTPNMKKIGERESLLMYVKLYIILLVRNIT